MGDADVIAATRIVGRDDEKRLLRERIDGAAAGQPCAVLVHGEAGIGKTSLVRSVVADAARAGVTVLWGQMPPVRRRGVDVPPVRAGDRGLAAGSTHRRPGGGAPRRLGRRAAAAVARRSRSGRAGAAHAGRRRDPLAGSWRSDRPCWSSTTSSGRPRPTWDALGYLLRGVPAPARWPSSPPTATRNSPRGTPSGAGWPTCDACRPSPPLPLGRLRPEETEDQLVGLLGGPVQQRLLREVSDRSGGNPYLTEMLVEGLSAEGGLPARRSARRAGRGVARRLAPDVVAGPEGGPGAGGRRPTGEPGGPRRGGLGTRPGALGRGGRGRRGGGAGDHGARSRRGVVPAPPARRGPAGHAAAGPGRSLARGLGDDPGTDPGDRDRGAAPARGPGAAPRGGRGPGQRAVAFSLRAARLAHELGRATGRGTAPAAGGAAGGAGRHRHRCGLPRPARGCGPRLRPGRRAGARGRPVAPGPRAGGRARRPAAGEPAVDRAVRPGVGARARRRSNRSGRPGRCVELTSGHPDSAEHAEALANLAFCAAWAQGRADGRGGRPERRGGRPTVRLAASPGGGARGPRVRDEGRGQLSRGHRRGPAPGRADRRPRAAGGRLHLAVQLPVGPGAGRRRRQR